MVLGRVERPARSTGTALRHRQQQDACAEVSDTGGGATKPLRIVLGQSASGGLRSHKRGQQLRREQRLHTPPSSERIWKRSWRLAHARPGVGSEPGIVRVRGEEAPSWWRSCSAANRCSSRRQRVQNRLPNLPVAALPSSSSAVHRHEMSASGGQRASLTCRHHMSAAAPHRTSPGLPHTKTRQLLPSPSRSGPRRSGGPRATPPSLP